MYTYFQNFPRLPPHANRIDYLPCTVFLYLPASRTFRALPWPFLYGFLLSSFCVQLLLFKMPLQCVCVECRRDFGPGGNPNITRHAKKRHHEWEARREQDISLISYPAQNPSSNHLTTPPRATAPPGLSSHPFLATPSQSFLSQQCCLDKPQFVRRPYRRLVAGILRRLS